MKTKADNINFTVTDIKKIDDRHVIVTINMGPNIEATLGSKTDLIEWALFVNSEESTGFIS